MKNKLKIITLLLITIISVMTSLGSSLLIYESYERQIENYNAHLVNEILIHHPELEEEIIEILISDLNNNTDKLEELGLDYDSFKYLKSNTYLKKYIIVTNISIVLTVMTLILTIYFLDKYKTKKKIKEIDKYMHEVLSGNYTLDIRDYDEGIFSNLKNDIYKVTIKLKEQSDISKKDKKELETVLSDISHQLKTPLTSMYVINDLLRTNLSDDKRLEFLNKEYKSIEKIEWLVTSLLKISMLDSGTIKLNPENTNLLTLINKSIDPIRIQIELKKLTIEINCDKDLFIYVDSNWVSEALTNIIKNAYEHTLVEGVITITCNDNPIYTEIKIKDNGLGIKKDDLKHIFERFYKASNSSKESIGIGLNMTKKIIDMSGGDISVLSKENEYTEFIVKVYKKDDKTVIKN